MLSRNRKSDRNRKSSRLRIESLETRTLLASDLAAISGLAYRDVTGNGYNAGEELSGASIQLFRDNGDGIFSAATDTLLGSKVTDAAGKYRFDSLNAGNYFVQQQAVQAGNVTLPAKISGLISITPQDAMGTMYTVIDSFGGTQQTVTANSQASQNSSSVLAPEAIGGNRKLAVSLDQAIGTIGLAANDPNSGFNVLDYSATSTATGSRRAIWDGGGGAGDTVNATGLGGIDLTKAGANSGLAMVIGADKVGVITLTLYTDANNYSTATVQIPNTGGAATSQVYVPFSSFAVAGGIGATLSSIGAIQLDIAANATAADGQIDTIGAIGPTVKAVNFDNLTTDLELTKTVDNPAPQLHGNVTFTIGLTNVGALNATGVSVRDSLPSGLTYVSSSASQGSYDPTTGVWTVGNVEKGASKSLTIIASVNTIGAKTNTAEILTANEQDIDSTPGNSVTGEDDQASVTLSPMVIDLSLTKTVNNTSPNLGQDVTFTITVRNDGPDTATGVAVRDALPVGLTYKTYASAAGNYDSSTGIWSVGNLPVGGTATLSLVATVTTTGVKTNTAEISAADQSDIDSTPDNHVATEDDQASVSLTPQAADLSLTKTVDATTVMLNQNVAFSITVRNDGPSNATGVKVNDLLPEGLLFQSATVSAGTYDELTGVWDVGAINTGETRTLQIVAKVTKAGTSTNMAQISAADQADADSTPNNNNPAEDDQASVDVTAIKPTPAPPPHRFSKLLFLAR